MAAGVLAIGLMNGIVLGLARPHMVTSEAANKAQVAIVLGAGVYRGGVLSGVLKERMDVAVQLYLDRKVDRLLLSGDHGYGDYDEVNAMRVYAEKRGVPREHIFLDHAGFSTYDTMARARRVFEVQTAIVVTNRFHLARAVFLARSQGIEAQGVSGQGNFDLYTQREMLARCKDLIYALYRPDPELLGPPVPITGDARLSHDGRDPR